MAEELIENQIDNVLDKFNLTGRYSVLFACLLIITYDDRMV